jgi:hypothetical protein
MASGEAGGGPRCTGKLTCPATHHNVECNQYRIDRAAAVAGPADPVTPMVQGSIALHQTMLGYEAGGFTPSQALYLCGCIVREQFRLAAEASREDGTDG